MNVIGISGGIKSGNQDGAAALLVDGQLVAAAEEERFLGIKFANGLLPKHAVRFCLQRAGLTIRDIDAIVFAGATYQSIQEILVRYFNFHFGFAPRVELADHHTAHAASTYYSSGWDRALVITMDFSGDRKSTTVSLGDDGRLEPIEEIAKPNSLGAFYSAVTQYLGFGRDSDEYKVMGMAAHGRPKHDLSNLLEIVETGYEFHHELLCGLRPDAPGPSKQERLFDTLPIEVPPRVPGEPITQEHFDIAASAQKQLERAVVQLVRHAVSRTGVDRVCLAGGVALNCLMNQEVRESGLVSALYTPPVCTDAGLALGAAYLVAHEAGDRLGAFEHAYWGPDYDAGEIKAVLDRAGASYTETDNPVEAAAKRIADGWMVGWFQGRMELGPRALGNRSILANPQIASIKDRINERVKFREQFRPLAPSVRHENGADYFERYVDSPFMTQTFSAIGRTASEAPAVVHADGTSRLQSVHSSTNARYHELIGAVGERTGLPMVLNTSLNTHGDPIACDPFHALRTFFTTGLESLVIGDFVLDKKSP